MKFSIWLNEEEQQMIMPSARQFSYIGCVLDEIAQGVLINLAKELFLQQNGFTIPQNWSFKTHHMTLKPRPQEVDMKAMEPFFGKQVILHIKGFASDQNICAFTVDSNIAMPLKNEIPHITIAHSKAVDARQSNDLLRNNKIINTNYSKQIASYCLAVQYDQNKVWPSMNVKLASPTPSA